MKEQYKWDYKIKIKTKEGTFEYEKEDLSNLDLLLEKYPEYEEIRAEKSKCKKKVLKRTNNGNNDNNSNTNNNWNISTNNVR